MASQNNIYPLFFILERVCNGYILTAKEETVPTTDKTVSTRGRCLGTVTSVTHA